MVAAALSDLLAMNQTTPSPVAMDFINGLLVNYLKVQAGGSIRGGDRYNEIGETVDEVKAGFFIGSDGRCKVSGIEMNGYVGTTGLAGMNWTGADRLISGPAMSHGSGPGLIAYQNDGKALLYFPGNGKLCVIENVGVNGWQYNVGGNILTLTRTASYPSSMTRYTSSNFALLRKDTTMRLSNHRRTGNTVSTQGSDFYPDDSTSNSMCIVALDELNSSVGVIQASTPIADSIYLLPTMTTSPTSGFIQDGSRVTLSTGFTNIYDIHAALMDYRTLVLLVRTGTGPSYSHYMVRYEDSNRNPIRAHVWVETSRVLLSGEADCIYAKSPYELLYTTTSVSACTVGLLTWTGSEWVTPTNYIEQSSSPTSDFAVPVNGTDYIIYEISSQKVILYRMGYALNDLYRPNDIM